MPRIRDAYLDCVVYLYPSEIDAENGVRIGGSGFLIGMVDDQNGLAFIYVATNKHVIEGGSHVVRMKTKDGGNAILSTDERAWIYHPDGDDLAIAMLVFDPRKLRLSVVKPSDFLTKDIVSKFNIGPGDETFLVGRFVNHEGKQQNLPTVRFGCIAQMPLEPVKQEGNFPQDSFLVESRSTGGYSGSPVFIYIPFGSERENVANWAPGSDLSDEKIWGADFGVMQSHGPWLLGVDWGHLNDWKPVCGPMGQPINPNSPASMQVGLNTGMMTVVPAWKLNELLFSAELITQRDYVAERLRRAEGNVPPAATSD